MSGHEEEVRVWQVKDGKQVAGMKAGHVLSLAASKNGKWIAAGTYEELFVWDAETYEEVIKYGEGDHVLDATCRQNRQLHSHRLGPCD